MILERQQKAARLKEQSETCEDDCGRYGSRGGDRGRLFDTTTKGL